MSLERFSLNQIRQCRIIGSDERDLFSGMGHLGFGDSLRQMNDRTDWSASTAKEQFICSLLHHERKTKCSAVVHISTTRMSIDVAQRVSPAFQQGWPGLVGFKSVIDIPTARSRDSSLVIRFEDLPGQGCSIRMLKRCSLGRRTPCSIDDGRLKCIGVNRSTPSASRGFDSQRRFRHDGGRRRVVQDRQEADGKQIDQWHGVTSFLPHAIGRKGSDASRLDWFKRSNGNQSLILKSTSRLPLPASPSCHPPTRSIRA